MSIFEAIMLICFGLAWPLSIYRSWKSKSTAGKSLSFLIVVLVGYASGITHKILFSMDNVIYLYIANAIMVFADVLLYLRNKKLQSDKAKN
ncbi:MAG TPA: hypothetical protein PLP05_03480 [Sedimentisphaerales bacterium]|nr:hypothetical protein [Sedimentisphaerales bacterium]